ncbi:MAG: glutamyl-tRNA reductase [Deltaproteobacteria bacterium]|nr:glutamyl-tRNA reductase [Deltaproteobacteria bacterium]
MGLIVVGLSHHTAPVDLREQVVYSKDDAVAALKRLKADPLLPQAMLLSTCNRTELYALAADDEQAQHLVKEQIFADRMKAANGNGEQYLYRHAGDKVVEHLYRVTCGLDSMVIGEAQILGQVKDAYALAQAAATSGTVLHRLVNGAVRVGKRARTETEIGTGAVSVASIAVELAEKVFQTLKGRRALLVGAGENGRLVAQHLLAHEIASLTICNRTYARAEGLAQELGGDARPFEELADALAKTDVVVSTTGAPEPVITGAMVGAAMKKRNHESLVLLDIAVPRDIDPAADSHGNVFRFDMDALSAVIDGNFERRKGEIPAVLKLIEGEVSAFLRFWASLDAGPVIRDLHAAFESVRSAEVEKNARRFADQDRDQLQVFSRSLMQKLLAGVTQEIKKYQRTNPVEMERLAALRTMFGLGEPQDPHDPPLENGDSDDVE